MDVVGLVVALHDGGGHAQVLKTAVGAGADEHGVHGDVLDAHARLQSHVGDGTLGGGTLGLVVEGGRIRHHAGDLHALARVGAPRDVRLEVFGVDGHFLVEHGIVIGLQRLPIFDGLVPHLTFRRVRTALQVFESHLVRGDHACAGAGFDGHVADGHAGIHRQLLDGFATVFDDVALAAAGADLRDDGQNNILGGDALRQVALDVHGHGLERLQAQGLRGHDVLHFGGADADGHSAERAVGGGVRVAAHDGHARLGQTQHRSERVDHALVSVAERAQTHAEILAVLFQRAQLERRSLVRIRTVDVDGRRVVVFRGNQLVDVTWLASCQTQTFERLRAGHFVHEHQVDVQQVGSPIATLAYQMIGPDLLGQCRSHCGTSSDFFLTNFLAAIALPHSSCYKPMGLKRARGPSCRYMRYE